MKSPKLLLLLCIALASCSKTRVIDYPEVMAANTRAIEISRIELSDTATIIHMDAYNSPGNWIRIASDSYLRGNTTDKIYKLIRSEGFELDKEVPMPESGNVPFRLFFEPLDPKERTMEFVEGHDEGAFLISGIQLVEKKEKGKIKCRIRGTVIDRPYSSRLIVEPWNSDMRIAPWISVPIHDGKFDYTFYADAEEAYEIIFYDEYRRGSWRHVNFFAENGDIEFTLYPMAEADNNVVSTKGPLNNALKEYDEKLSAAFDFSALYEERDRLDEEDRYHSEEYKKWIDDIENASSGVEADRLYKVRDELERSGNAYSPEGRAINEKRDSLENARIAWQLENIRKDASPVGYFKLLQLVSMAGHPITPRDPAPYFALYEEVYKEKYPDHPFTWKMETAITGNSTKVGGRYIDFSAPDAQGNEVKLSDKIGGHVALIDLWASWCGPCRRLSVSMIPVYEKYKDRGFTIVGVARENKLSDMVRAAEQDGYPWLTLVELEDKAKI